MTEQSLKAAAPPWVRVAERGSLLGLRLMVLAYRYVGRWLFSALLYVVILYFYLFARAPRRASREYLARLSAARPDLELAPTWFTGYRHFLSLGQVMLDKLLALSGGITLADVTLHDHEVMAERVNRGEGGLVLTAHLGNLEAMQALSEANPELRLNIFVHTKNAQKFNDLLSRVKPEMRARLVEVTELGPDTAMDLAARVQAGEWLVSAADRLALLSDRSLEVDFLGGRAALPAGPFVLAGLLGCPVMFLVCLKLEGRYHIFYEPFAEKLEWKRGTRDQVLTEAAQRYADRLAHYCAVAPLQWFNFFPFWRS